MDKSILDSIVNTFKERSVEFKFDYYIFQGKICLKGFFVYNKKQSDIKSIIDSTTVKELQFKKTLSWYLGDRKEILHVSFKNEMETTIPELENYHINNEV